MARNTAEPQILAEARTTGGTAFQLRKDSKGVLVVPGLETVLVTVHLGAPARIDCRRDGKRFAGTAVHGDIDIIPARTPARWEMHDENDSSLLLSLPQSALRSIVIDTGADPDRLEIRNRFQVRDPELEALLWVIKREMETGFRSGPLYLDGLALAVASRIVACHSSLAPAPMPRIEGLAGNSLKKVLSFIEEHLPENLSLEQIASAAGMGVSHFKAQFRKAVGMPVHRYVIRRRVERARSLLLEDGLSMADVAQASGFAHQSHMEHMRRVLGAAPRTMQRMLAKTTAFR
ncbi:MAG TPA: AraC family transcriptional regulator [Bryobacteraceae bacterium]|nr:AraC family transcriptional regulator [Bryobacteraceae bacterium]